MYTVLFALLLSSWTMEIIYNFVISIIIIMIIVVIIIIMFVC